MRRATFLIVVLTILVGAAVSCKGGAPSTYGTVENPYKGVLVSEFKNGDRVTVLGSTPSGAYSGTRPIYSTEVRNERTGNVFWLPEYAVEYTPVYDEIEDVAYGTTFWGPGDSGDLMVSQAACFVIVLRNGKVLTDLERASFRKVSPDLCPK
ncbi:MAG: hypothetical protein A2172_02435 [Candidatus Woykebacteria bacterium RBG_13_40_15]|uniref:DUF5666 domain-containing protein n=1 Tax=Candidatus Woykebacteria bacterium RBG_13_40_15 TaxID=1802593 RepID=A0A1G1W6J5_9BACT|nr:MAG: hypothetical protein A2172_02435 [Candidatus Woykebacteria bacterium RBG_13_40_15]